METRKDPSLVFRDMSAETNRAEYPLISGQKKLVNNDGEPPRGSVTLNLEGTPTRTGNYDLRLSAWRAAGSELLGAAELPGVDAAKLRGSVAMVSHSGGRNVTHVFESFQVGGRRFVHHPDRAFGPVAGTLYTVFNNTLKLSAQFMHLGEAVSLPSTEGAGEKTMRLQAHLETRIPGGAWKPADGPKPVAGPDFYVPFRVEGWDPSREAEARVVFRDVDGNVYRYVTRIGRDPVHQPTVSIAGFTGMGVMGRVASAAGRRPQTGQVIVGRWRPANVWMPFAGAVRAVNRQKVDLLFFTGDQIYENKPSFKDASVEPKLDYLYKWLLWHWSFRELTSHLPAIVQPDDHDVYHGNLWGWGGRLNLTGNNADGGYLCSPYFVNMVHRTQTGHLPDPYDPSPVLNGLSNYYTRFAWGGVGFAVLEDRKFKTPRGVTDPAGQVLLGDRQKQMLREWGEDWRDQKFKCVVSQTIYASMHVGFDGAITADRDTNGFPKARRDEVVHLFRRCGAFVLSGDQHLSTLARLGVEQPSDAVYQFSVPAIGNIFWRWFYPQHPGADRRPGAPDYTGEFTDGLGNFFRMIAVANPERRSLLEQKLRQRYLIPAGEARGGLGDETRASQGDGYGVVRFDKDTRTVTVECWPHNADPGAGGKQFAGWPVTVEFDQLDGRRPAAWLPDLEIAGVPDPVVQIIDQETGEVVKITRARGGSYSPGVFNADGVYMLRVGVPESDLPWWTAKDLRPTLRPGEKSLRVELR
jgi:alkaline phosphatase D